MGEPLRALPPGFDDLPVEDQIDYVQFLWDRIAARPERVPVPKWHEHVIEERLDELERNPDAERPWEQVEADLRARLRRE